MAQANVDAEGFLRIWQIVGDTKRGIQPLIPISPSSWWKGCRSGKYPAPLRIGPRTTAWRRSEVLALLRRLEGES